MIYAVIDTNVVVSSLITKNNHAATYLVMRHLFEGHVTPLYNQEILTEYAEVLALTCRVRPSMPLFLTLKRMA